MTDARGYNIDDHCMRGKRLPDRVSWLRWPNQGRPLEPDWKYWRQQIRLAFLHPRTTRLLAPLGRWTNRSHQRWTWSYDSITDRLYKQDGNVYKIYKRDQNMRTPTRSHTIWYIQDSVAQSLPPHHLRFASIIRSTTRQVLFSGASLPIPTHFPSFVEVQSPTTNIEKYYTFRLFFDGDDDMALSQKLQLDNGLLVGDGSYERRADIGASSFILEMPDRSSRVTNSIIVPSNPPSLSQKHNDSYRAELFSIFLGLITIYDIEQRYNTTFLPITVAVDNDSAL